jgi:exopolysaccharide production protein ExoZ
MPKSPEKLLYSIQTLRFFAAVGVVIHHSLTSLGAQMTTVLVGAAGVDIFFVISGVVIGSMDSRDGVLTFAIKRLIRLIPLYWLATLAYVLERYITFGLVPGWGHVIHSLLLLPDFSDPNWFPIYVPAWTLCFEATFYLMFALLLPLARPSPALAAIIISASLTALQVPNPLAPSSFFNTSLFMEFAVGLMIAQMLRHWTVLPLKFGALSLTSGLLIFAQHFDGWGGPELLGWGIPAALTVLGAVGLERLRFWRHRILVLGGNASYAIYLFHLTIMEPLLVKLEQSGIDLHSTAARVAMREVLLVGTAVLIGTLIHMTIERPLLGFLRKAAFGPRVDVRVAG